MTLATLWDVLSADDCPALLGGSGGPSFTRGQLRRLAAQFAATLRAAGVQPGDTVTIAEPNTVSWGLGGSAAGQATCWADSVVDLPFTH